MLWAYLIAVVKRWQQQHSVDLEQTLLELLMSLVVETLKHKKISS